MNAKIPQHIIDTLLVLGRMPDVDTDRLSEKFEVLRQYEFLNRLHWQDWRPVCDSLDVDSHIALLKALTLAECYGGWGNGGSVSAGIWVYHSLEEKVPYQAACDLARWVIDHNDNEYLPFGGPRKRSLFLKRESSALSNKNGSLMLELNVEENAIKQRNDQHHITQNEKAKAGRIQRKKQSSEQHQVRKNKFDDVRELVLEKAAGLDPIGHLCLIIEHPDLPLDCFPTEWADVAEGIISHIDKSLCDQLVARLSKKNHGPWRQLCLQLALISTTS
jgi:hypothetical protein